VELRAHDIVEQGSHAELLEHHGLYYSLYNSQFTEFQAAAS
jgi:ABC-type multidrug transport system fused ATPase/permease subunit